MIRAILLVSTKWRQNSGKTLALTKEETMIEEYRNEITRLINEIEDERGLWLIMRFAQLRVEKE